MPVIPLPALGVEAPVCCSCFAGDPRVAYREVGRGHTCYDCDPWPVTPLMHPWPSDVVSSVIERVAPLSHPSSLDVTYHNLCWYPEAAHAHPEMLARVVAWLQTAPAIDLPEPKGKHLGAPKERVELTLRLDPPTPFSLGLSDYGERFLFRFRDPEGNAVVWFSGENCWVPDGWSGVMKATVKEHTVYGGERQTIIQRGKEVSRDGGSD